MQWKPSNFCRAGNVRLLCLNSFKSFFICTCHSIFDHFKIVLYVKFCQKLAYITFFKHFVSAVKSLLNISGHYLRCLINVFFYQLLIKHTGYKWCIVLMVMILFLLILDMLDWSKDAALENWRKFYALYLVEYWL